MKLSLNTYHWELGCIILRHPQEGAAARAAKVSRVPIINAGDGRGEHPTQALTDVGTIKRRFGAVDDLTVVISGDLTGRTGRSLACTLAEFKSVKLVFASPPELRMKNDVLTYLETRNVAYTEHDRLSDVIHVGDVVYVTRPQRDKESGEIDYQEIRWDGQNVDNAMMQCVKQDAIIMHPLPRNAELSPEVDDDPRVWCFRQTEYSVPMRMAVLELAMGKNPHAESLANAA
ncbi:MAG: hypothetical protein AAB916_02215 [Patescibacteria group bacterium]